MRKLAGRQLAAGCGCFAPVVKPLSGYFFPSVSNPAMFYGGFIAVVIYTDNPFKADGKIYDFVSQNITLGNIVFTP